MQSLHSEYSPKIIFFFQVPDFYFAPLDAYQKRADIASRPELRKGTVDFVATGDIYNERPPQSACWLFVLEVTSLAFSTGKSSVQ